MKKPSGLALLEEFGVTGELAKDFVETRKAHKAPITRTALKALKREAGKANITLSEALDFAISMGWRGFRASWHESALRGFNTRQEAKAQKLQRSEPRPDRTEPSQQNYGKGWIAPWFEELFNNSNQEQVEG